MRKLSIILIIILLSSFIFSKESKAARLPPREVEPVIYNGVKYTAPHWAWEHGWKQNGGYIEAWDIKTQKKLWELKVYDIKYDPQLEGDVQDIFIISLSIENGELIIVNKHNDVYVVDLATRKVVKKQARPKVKEEFR